MASKPNLRMPIGRWYRRVSSLRAAAEPPNWSNISIQNPCVEQDYSLPCLWSSMQALYAARRYYRLAEHPSIQQCSGRVSKSSEPIAWSQRSAVGQLEKSFRMLDLVIQGGGSGLKEILYRLLKECTAKGNLGLGRRVHAIVVSSGYELDPFLGNHLIRMYASQGYVQEASQVFKKVRGRDTFVWASIISAHGESGEPEEAIKLYHEMRCSTVKPNDYVFVAVLKACARACDLSSGRHVHSDVIQCGFESNVFVASILVDMYVKCKNLEEARRVFDRLPTKNVVTYSSMIVGHAHLGSGEDALKLYAEMRSTGMSPDKVTYVCLLKACNCMHSLQAGEQIHFEILDRGLESDPFIANSLVDMYVKCDSLVDARRVFDRLPKKDVITWSAMIAGYCQHGLGKGALKLYRQMEEDGITHGNTVTFSSILKACGSIGDLQEGKRIHAQVLERGVDLDVYVGSALVDMYAKCGSLEDAYRVLDRMFTKDVVIWNAMAAGFANQGLSREAVNLYTRMRQSDVAADTATFLIMLKACGRMKALQEGRHMHAQILERELKADVSVGNALIDMYARCESLSEASEVFESMPRKSVVTWNAMIGGYAQKGLGLEALQLYERMQHDGVSATATTYVSILKACGAIGAIQEGNLIHAELMGKGLEADVYVGSTLVDMFAKCGDLDASRKVFDRLPTKSTVAWNAMIGGYAGNGIPQEALKLYEAMLKDSFVKPDVITFVTMLQLCSDIASIQHGTTIHGHVMESRLEGDPVVGSTLMAMYAKCGNLEEARKVFDCVLDRDVVIWTAMISLYVQHNRGKDALRLYKDMEGACVPPNAGTFVSILKACASTGAMREGKRIHGQVKDGGLVSDISVGNMLIDMYGKCGSMLDAQRVFDNMNSRNVVTWSALINGYGQRNDCEMAMQCFRKMVQDGVQPNEATFTALLVACCHVGSVAEGKQYFNMIAEQYGMMPTAQHYTCMVDLLGRAGLMAEAENMLQTMPWEGDSVGWMALLNACRSHGDIERGRLCFDHLVRVEPKEAGAYVLMSNIYASAGRWADVNKIQAMRIGAGAHKKPAKAMIEVENKVHEFTVGEKHSDLSSKLKKLSSRLKKEGHVPKTDLVLRRMPEKHKEELLCGHAEKLAIAFGLLNTRAGTRLLVTKNLRMCGDCHSGSKILSKIENREIVVRDAHRVHHFKNGVCSCRDHY